MNKMLEILGCIEVEAETTQADVENKFMEFVETNGWHFLGVINDDLDKKDDELLYTKIDF